MTIDDARARVISQMEGQLGRSLTDAEQGMVTATAATDNPDKINITMQKPLMDAIKAAKAARQPLGG